MSKWSEDQLPQMLSLRDKIQEDISVNVLLTVLSVGSFSAVVAFYRATRDRGVADGMARMISVVDSSRRTDFLNLFQDETGQDLIEYALVAALIALGAVVSMKSLSTKIGAAFTTVGTELTSAV